MNSKKNILIIGGSGFLGSHVADRLSKDSYRVKIFDIQKSIYIKKNQSFINGNILDFNSLLKATKNCHAVFHFGGMADIEYSNKHPIKTIETNILGTLNVLNACSQNKVKRFILASTAYVYSNKGGFYRASKQCSELLTETFFQEKKLKYTILRFGSLYGPRADSNNFIYNIINQALKYGYIERKGTGSEIRSYVHVYDAAKSCSDILSSSYENKNVMITGGQKIKVDDLLKMITEIFDKKIKIKYSKKRFEGHYESSPYSFKPKIAMKINRKDEVELGQGLLDLIYKLNDNIQ